MQEFIGTGAMNYQPLVTVLVGQVVDRLGEPDGIIASTQQLPKRGTHSVGSEAGNGVATGGRSTTVRLGCTWVCVLAEIMSCRLPVVPF